MFLIFSNGPEQAAIFGKTKQLKACQQLALCLGLETYIFEICFTLIRLENSVKAIKGK